MPGDNDNTAGWTLVALAIFFNVFACFSPLCIYFSREKLYWFLNDEWSKETEGKCTGFMQKVSHSLLFAISRFVINIGDLVTDVLITARVIDLWQRTEGGYSVEFWMVVISITSLLTPGLVSNIIFFTTYLYNWDEGRDNEYLIFFIACSGMYNIVWLCQIFKDKKETLKNIFMCTIGLILLPLGILWGQIFWTLLFAHEMLHQICVGVRNNHPILLADRSITEYYGIEELRVLFLSSEVAFHLAENMPQLFVNIWLMVIEGQVDALNVVSMILTVFNAARALISFPRIFEKFVDLQTDHE